MTRTVVVVAYDNVPDEPGGSRGKDWSAALGNADILVAYQYPVQKLGDEGRPTLDHSTSVITIFCKSPVDFKRLVRGPLCLVWGGSTDGSSTRTFVLENKEVVWSDESARRIGQAMADYLERN